VGSRGMKTPTRCEWCRSHPTAPARRPGIDPPAHIVLATVEHGPLDPYPGLGADELVTRRCVQTLKVSMSTSRSCRISVHFSKNLNGWFNVLKPLGSRPGGGGGHQCPRPPAERCLPSRRRGGSRSAWGRGTACRSGSPSCGCRRPAPCSPQARAACPCRGRPRLARRPGPRRRPGCAPRRGRCPCPPARRRA